MRVDNQQQRLGRHDLVVRGATTLALVAGTGYLVWRATNLGPHAWLSIPLFLLEVWGLAQLGLLAQLGWTRRRPLPTASGDAPSPDQPVDAVVTCTFQEPEELERTLIACRSLQYVDRLIVVVRAGRPALAATAERCGVTAIEAEGNHVDQFLTGMAAGRAPLVAWIEAGQVPMPDLVSNCAAVAADPAVAVVQARHGMINGDSLSAMRGGRDEDAFRQEVAYPAQGRRGTAPWIGGGSVVRVEALHSIGELDTGDQAALGRALIRLHRHGWTSRFWGERPLLLDTAPDSLEAYLTLRRRRAIEALRVYATPESPLHTPGLSLAQRLRHVAHGASYLTAVRQLGLTVVL
ncbi:MAG: hypothetical protein AAFN30_05185, partial [Actinomycetota bacterium]